MYAPVLRLPPVADAFFHSAPSAFRSKLLGDAWTSFSQVVVPPDVRLQALTHPIWSGLQNLRKLCEKYPPTPYLILANPPDRMLRSPGRPEMRSHKI